MADEAYRRGHSIALDLAAKSASPGMPAFIARPSGAPVYYGFAVLEDVEVDGFTLGVISDFEAEECKSGDAFVIAPDNSRAGLVWDYEGSDFEMIRAPEPSRWGVWGVRFDPPMRTRDDARRNLTAILPRLKEQ